MKRNCPKNSCKSPHYYKDGFYFRANDSRKIQRFKCKACGSKFSASTGTLEFGQKKRRVNPLLLKLFCAKVTQKRAARIVGVNKTTVARKFDYWSKKAAIKNSRFRQRISQNKISHIQFDDLITKEKTKLKPLSVSVVVDAKRRFILDANVSQIASFGHLATLSVKKYGRRKSNHLKILDYTFKNIASCVDECALIESDEHKNYKPIVNKYFSKAQYIQYKSQKSCIAGQGELKQTKHDPIFTIEHTLAMMRDSISTLVRRSWCVSQDPKRLQGHLDIFIYYYNQFYLGGISPP